MRLKGYTLKHLDPRDKKMKPKLIIATNNQDKAQEIKEILGDIYQCFSLKDLGLKIDPQENGDTFLDNALIKARAVFDKMGGSLAAVADDSGLIVPALGGEPGIMSARYAGDDSDDEKNNQKLLQRLQDVKDRRAYFVCVVVFINKNQTIFAEGKTYGEILSYPVGDNGFGYDPLFYSYDLKMSFGQATPEQKNQVSHRARALNQLKQKLKALV